MNKIGILTSGGDCSGMNACIRSAVRTALRHNLAVVGFRKGYAGLMKGDCFPLENRAVSGIMHRGGTFLQSARSPEFRTLAGQQQALRGRSARGCVLRIGERVLFLPLVLHQRLVLLLREQHSPGGGRPLRRIPQLQAVEGAAEQYVAAAIGAPRVGRHIGIRGIWHYAR